MEKYITPTEFWAEIDDLKPFSDAEVKLITQSLTRPVNWGPMGKSFDIGTTENHEYGYGMSSFYVEKLIEFLTEIKNTGSGDVQIIFKERDYGYTEGYEKTITFSRERDETKFSAEEGRRVRHEISDQRRRAVENEERKKLLEAREEKIEKIVRDFKDDKLNLAEFQRLIQAAQK